LPDEKWFFDACRSKNGFLTLAGRKMLFRRLPNEKWFLDACRVKNGFLMLAGRKMVF